MTDSNKNKNTTDINLFGAVSIRFQNVEEDELKAIIGKLINWKTNPVANPDIVFRFVNKLEPIDAYTLGLNYAMFDDKNFYIISDQITLKKVVIPFEKIGENIEIVCERGVRSIPLLYHLINFYLIRKNFVPVHSSGIYYERQGILTMGWSNGGKTSILLALANHGAEYVGDEWVILKNDGTRMYGYPIPLTLSKWQLTQVKDYRDFIDLNEKITLIFLGIWVDLLKWAIKLGLADFNYFKSLDKFLRQTRKLLRKKVAPHKIFKNSIKSETTIDFLVLSRRHMNSEILIEKCDSDEIISRMIHSNDYEQMPFFEYYKAFRYAFPERNNKFIENIKSYHADLLSKALRGKNSFKVFSPNPVSLEDLYNTIHQTLLK